MRAVHASALRVPLCGAHLSMRRGESELTWTAQSVEDRAQIRFHLREVCLRIHLLVLIGLEQMRVLLLLLLLQGGWRGTGAIAAAAAGHSPTAAAERGAHAALHLHALAVCGGGSGEKELEYSEWSGVRARRSDMYSARGKCAQRQRRVVSKIDFSTASQKSNSSESNATTRSHST